MARLLRSNGEFLHIVMRGVGQQVLFEDDRDRRYFLVRLAQYREDSELEILAYCLMENHVHLLVRDTGGNVPLLMQRIGVSYAGYYNRAYDRSGHLFQGRYGSQIVEDEQYLISAFRYILRNPEKAGICSAAEYRWSSYADYCNGRAGVPGVTDAEFMRGVMDEFGGFARVMAEDDDAAHFEGMKPAHDDEWALAMIRKTFGCKSGTELQKLQRGERDEALRKLKGLGLSIRQIPRLTGINRNIVQRS